MYDHSSYALLQQPHIRNNNNWANDKKLIVVVCTLSLPVIIFCISYVALFGIYEKNIYPKTFTFKEVPKSILNRAIIYNTILDSKTIANNVTWTNNNRKTPTVTNATYKLICYYNFPSPEDFINILQPHEIDPFLCTHINVAFAHIQNNSVQLEEHEYKALDTVVRLKQLNRNLKVLLSVGGASDDLDGFAQMVLNHASRKIFIQSVLNLVKNNGIDGVDLDWEFPNRNQNGDKKQRMHFTQLLEEFRACINRQSENNRFLVSVAVGAPSIIVDQSYDVQYMNQFVDFVNLMSYDFHFFTKTTPFTGLNAPLYQSSSEKLYLATLNINFTANYWFFKGMDRNRIVIGLPTYAHSFRLVNKNNNGLYAAASGYGRLGNNGFADFSQVCTFLTTNQISPIFDMDTKSPYAYKNFEWISFDDDQSLSYKAEFIRDNKFGGAMVYSMNMDDHKGFCNLNGERKAFPLINTIKKVLNL